MKNTRKSKKIKQAEEEHAEEEVVRSRSPRLTTRELCWALLTLDHLCRRKKRWPLFPLHSLVELSANTHPHSTRVPHTGYGSTIDPSHPLFHGDQEVKQRLHDGFPALDAAFEAAGERLRNVVVAGGAVSWASSTAGFSRRSGKTDVDLFFFGMSEWEASGVVQRMLEAVVRHHGADNVELTRTRWCITACASHCPDQWSKVTYQFILRLYEGLDQVIGGFDLAACAVAYSPLYQRVFVTPLAAYCMATRKQIVDTGRRSPTFSQRLWKYRVRGLDMIFPGLRWQEKYRSHKRSTGMNFSRRSAYNQTRSTASLAVNARPWYWLRDKTLLDYGGEHPGLARLASIIACAQSNPDAVTHRADSVEQVLSAPQSILNRAYVEKCYRNRGADRIRSWMFEHGPVADVFKRWYGDERFMDFVLAAFREDDVEGDRITRQTVDHIMHMAERARNNMRGALKWMTVDPGKQFTGSFQPQDANPRQFYGESQYAPFYVGMRSPEHVVCMELLRRKHALWKRLPRGVYELILQWTIYLDATQVALEACGDVSIPISDADQVAIQELCCAEKRPLRGELECFQGGLQ